jgi:hypothetical protein
MYIRINDKISLKGKYFHHQFIAINFDQIIEKMITSSLAQSLQYLCITLYLQIKFSG